MTLWIRLKAPFKKHMRAFSQSLVQQPQLNTIINSKSHFTHDRQSLVMNLRNNNRSVNLKFIRRWIASRGGITPACSPVKGASTTGRVPHRPRHVPAPSALGRVPRGGRLRRPPQPGHPAQQRHARPLRRDVEELRDVQRQNRTQTRQGRMRRRLRTDGPRDPEVPEIGGRGARTSGAVSECGWYLRGYVLVRGAQVEDHGGVSQRSSAGRHGEGIIFNQFDRVVCVTKIDRWRISLMFGLITSRLRCFPTEKVECLMRK